MPTIEAIRTAQTDRAEGREPIGRLFSTGIVLTTPGAQNALTEAHGENARRAAVDLLIRHTTGDWGDVPAEDRRANWQALEKGYRVLSVYKLPAAEGREPVTLWTITDAGRDYTTILLPSEN